MSTIDAIDDLSQDFSGEFSSSPNGGLILIRITQQKRECTAPNRPLLKAVSIDKKTVVFFHPRCGMWNCPACGEINAYKAVRRAAIGEQVIIDAGMKLDFITVTSHEKLTPTASLAVLPKAWNKLNIRIKRELTGLTIEYFTVPEQHKDGRWHMHGLTTAKLPRKWWKDNARECGLGYQSDVQEVSDLGGVAPYIGKYMTKMLQNTNLPKHFRRIRTSKGWPKLPNVEPLEGWQVMTIPHEASLQSETDTYQAAGITCVIADEISSWDYMKNWA